ncbi:MAG TPA: hypothetical protein P5246_03235, partial [Candidatus Omnitrophota bacterium]|nr:hypothetical protein [Candidatus Omnitrophota bacterium]
MLSFRFSIFIPILLLSLQSFGFAQQVDTVAQNKELTRKIDTLLEKYDKLSKEKSALERDLIETQNKLKAAELRLEQINKDAGLIEQKLSQKSAAAEEIAAAIETKRQRVEELENQVRQLLADQSSSSQARTILEHKIEALEEEVGKLQSKNEQSVQEAKLPLGNHNVTSDLLGDA